MPILNKELTTKEKVAAALIELNSQITTADRRAYLDEKGCTMAHLSTYMNGRGLDLDTAAEMLVVMKNRVDKREQLIQSHL